MNIVVDGQPLPFEPGDSVAIAVLRAGEHPHHGGCLCLAGDCGSCVAEVDGVAFVRTCQTLATPGLVVRRHPVVGAPPLVSRRDPMAGLRDVPTRHSHADIVVIGAGASGRAVAGELSQAGRDVMVLDAARGHEVVGIYPGPTVVVRSIESSAASMGNRILPAEAGLRGQLGIHQIRANEVVIATGAAEVQPVCPGNKLRGIVTASAAATLQAAGVDLGRVVCVGDVLPTVSGERAAGRLVRFEGGDRVERVVVETVRGEESLACDTAVVGLGRAARDVLSRMSDEPGVRLVGPAAERFALPPCPTAGVVCPCSGTTVEDLDGAWERGFTHLELLKRATLTGTGTCQGGVCLPHLRAFVADRLDEIPAPFTARPISRQLTMGEAAAHVHLDAWRRSPLHDEHLRLGARMDRFGGWWRPWNYGDAMAEYWAVRQGVSLGDVSTLGKMIVSGPDVVEALERLYPNHVHDIRPGRSRYVLLLNERGHLIDDGMIVRESDTRFVLTFTSGGAAAAEMWVRDWIETWGLRVHVLDRTMALAAINVTGPLAGDLLTRVGLTDQPRFLQHVHTEVAGVPCHVMRLSFTGETSFELHHPVDRSVELWSALMDAGRPLGVMPHGLQALFGLRLEKGHIIVGMDTELDTAPRRVGMDWAVKMDKADFLGRSGLARTDALPNHRRLAGLTMDGPAPTEGMPIFDDGAVIGHVTSSFASPALGRTVMLGWLKRTPFPESVTIDGRRAHITATPFYDPEGARARM